MITFNNIVERFEDFATSHFFIKSFSFGSPDDVDLAKFTEFPLMHLVYTGATYDTGTKTYNIEVYILDVPADKTDKVERQREVVSDAEQCAEDIIADIRMGGNIFTFAQDYEVVNATTTPLEEETKNVLSGVLLDLSVAIPYEWDACNAPIDGVSPEGGDEPSYARRGFLRMLTLDGSTDVLSVRTIKVTNGTLTDDGDGVVTLDTGGVETLDDLTDVDIISPDQGDVLSYNSGVQKWMVNGGLQELLARFKASGTGAQVYDTLNDTTKGYIDILANSAKMKVNLSGLTVTEASPGVMSFSVAAGTEGNEVEFEAMTIEGSDAVSTVADINFKQGSVTYWENSTGKIWLRAPNVGNITVLFPSSGGTLALTTDIPNVPVDSVNGQTGVVVLDTGDIDENGNLYFTDARVAANAAVAANTAKVGVIAGGTSGQALVKATGTDYDVEWADIAIDTQYHDRFQTDAETFRSGATATTELYYTAKADGDGLAQSASSDTPTAGKVIRRKIYYSEAAFADPDTGTWVEFTPAPADDASFATVKAALLEYLKARTGGTVPISLKQTWEEVTAAPAFTGLLNETYGSGAEAAYSVRRLNGNYTGAAIQVERSSDNTYQDIGFDANGDLDESALTTFCTGTTCKVRTWYGQEASGGTGSGNDAQQTDHTKQPTIYTGGALVKENGKVAVEFDGSNDILKQSGGILNGLSSYSLFSTFNPLTSATAYEAYLHQAVVTTPFNNTFQLRRDDANDRFNPISGQSLPLQNTTSSINNLQLLVSMLRNGATTNKIYQSGTFERDLTSNSYTINAGDFAIGGRSNDVNFASMKAQEFVIYGNDKSTDRTSIESNVGDYFTQNTPLLDTYSGAAAAYSLRLLDSTYTGSAIRVRRANNDEQDIGFNVFGELDTVSLLAFAGTGDAWVRTWYDQSGNSNDATQTTTANQPKIVSSGAVVVENGKPAIQGTSTTTELVASISHTITAQSTFGIGTYVHNSGASERFISQNNGGNDFSGSNVYIIGYASGTNSIASYINSAARSSITVSNNQHILFSSVHSGSSLLNAVNGTTGTAYAHTLNSTFSRFGIMGTGGSAVQGWQGKFQEVVMYTSDQSSNRTNIESNINTFYSIY